MRSNYLPLWAKSAYTPISGIAPINGITHRRNGILKGDEKMRKSPIHKYGANTTRRYIYDNKGNFLRIESSAY